MFRNVRLICPLDQKVILKMHEKENELFRITIIIFSYIIFLTFSIDAFYITRVTVIMRRSLLQLRVKSGKFQRTLLPSQRSKVPPFGWS